MNEEELRVLDEDKKSNPNCNYSTSRSQTCRSVNGQYVNDVMARITRMCPGKAPVDIYSNTTTENSDNSSASSSSAINDKPFHSPFSPFSGQSGHNLHDPFSIFDSIMKDFNHDFGSVQSPSPYPPNDRPFSFSFRRFQPPPPDQQFDEEREEHVTGKKPKNSKAKEGHVSGPIERI